MYHFNSCRGSRRSLRRHPRANRRSRRRLRLPSYLRPKSRRGRLRAIVVRRLDAAQSILLVRGRSFHRLYEVEHQTRAVLELRLVIRPALFADSIFFDQLIVLLTARREGRRERREREREEEKNAGVGRVVSCRGAN